MRRPLAAIVVALSIAPLHAQTSGPSGIQGVESDEFSPLMTIHGIVESENPLGGMFKTWNLRSFVGKFDGTTTHQLYVGVNYSSSMGRNWFNSASDDTATPLTVTHIATLADWRCSRNILANGCEYAEDIGIEVTTATLRAHAATGYRVKIYAKSGESFVLVISPNQIAAQLDTMQRCLVYVRAHSNVAVDRHRPQLLKTPQLGSIGSNR